MKLYARIEGDKGKEVDISANEQLSIILTHKNKPVFSLWLSIDKDKPVIKLRNWTE